MATRRDIREEIQAAHERDKLATEIYDTGYNEGKNAAASQQEAAAADLQKKYNDAVARNYDQANNQAVGRASNAPASQQQTANQAAVDKASKDLVSKDLMDEYLNRGKFSYNESADPLWQQYRRQYLEAGNKAMKDTLGKATALTGGYDNSYANIVAQQVNNEYAAKAADKIPELYQLALDRYNQEGQDILNRYELLYGREQDQAAADFEREKFEYQQSRDAVADQQWASEFGLKADAQKWAQYMDERQMTLNEAKFFLEEEIERGNLDIKKAQLALQKYETEQSVAQGWTKLDQSQQEINQGWTELGMRQNGTYFDRSGKSSGSNNPENESDEPEELEVTMSESQIATAAKSVMGRYNKAQSEYDLSELYRELHNKYDKDGSDNAAAILEKVQELLANVDNNITKRGNVKIGAYTD